MAASQPSDLASATRVGEPNVTGRDRIPVGCSRPRQDIRGIPGRRGMARERSREQRTPEVLGFSVRAHSRQACQDALEQRRPRPRQTYYENVAARVILSVDSLAGSARKDLSDAPELVLVGRDIVGQMAPAGARRHTRTI